ncbi:hypothetical protein A3C98_00485 [Candidatus Roizmanbacteria bacterium RIFCSPHIGHO2_02_FULL_37_15]|uniref:NAD-dependent epimerase/dehydratase domain-containing protein n=1 Tax=Candidatus Roizmanbacteria bacterium RIFCSPLOWO2_01_FULL_37_16 TaxID=1802058 RepID=A0A1F7IQT2_9BACT|nr:MAG: hypothetical protein A2859_02660 [Candidatus Roizmanbacteria bacterium RIFCSPHIGHO2_01_FULL_37_16b]OGK22210.1 MAG: hypothetical protein A3C98_00485 [Candidatus Roizmanbacteria bacterium RIFCSPHIGHO2_02_FULL_37_15]OGK33074.1 MAG: hypothetical protein A3F57_06360 [Candidatus Roizmanbacteria bacterium RIFCSPHIGHO2_12_FULL_36_11]OGK45725.1 MAG: hypothetical protein A3B40_05620 [Candidatus Roizmanbacteria bacterium RIFCSPLOWO2_01_FULL_37_16]
MKLKILLTGGNGFIGRNFIEQKNKKYHILHPTHSELDLARTKAVDNFFKKKGPFDIVLHAATVGGKRSEKGMRDVAEINLRIFFNIIRNKKYWKKMIHFGTGSEYDKSQDIKDVKEGDFGKRIPADSFGFYKYVTAKYIESLLLPIYHIRLFGIYGKYEDYHVRLTSNLICKYILRLPLTMIQNAYFDYLYIDDLIKILDFFIEKEPRYRFYNVGTGKSISLLSIAKIINRLSNYSMPIRVLKKGLNKEYTCDNSLLRKELKNFRFTPIGEGIRVLYSWYKKNWKDVDIKTIIEDPHNKL